ALTLSLFGSAQIVRRGRLRDYLLAGFGLGLACASKYTAGIALVPLAAASALQYLEAGDGRSRRVLGGLALAIGAALAGFLIANPYALLDYSRFHAELVRQSSLSTEAQGKLGAPKQGGLIYYLWSLTWGLGWLPALFALGGALTIWRKHARLGWMLVPPALLFLAFMGLQGRYFGRWLLPIFPIVCLLAAYFAVSLIARAAAALAARRVTASRRMPIAFATLLVTVLLAQGLFYSVHSGKVLARADTRNLTRAWMVAHIPSGTPIVVEPVAPDAWGKRWRKYPSTLSRISASGGLEPSVTREVGIEDYERTLSPALIGYYERHSYCWVVSGSTQSGRAYADPKEVPHAIAYYAALARQGEVAYRASPYSQGQRPVAFDFDWSFDYYPLAYDRPGPEMTVYRLHGGRCAH
ncbi:MAG TPA: hypothetical protein VGH56_02440, partial [Solirubrobacteraceae bacterium]